MNVYLVKTGSILPLGKRGENRARQIRFDISSWMDNFGPGTVQLLHQRSSDETPYPVAVEREGNLAVWTVTNADTAASGTGRAELQYYVGDALAKSETWMTKVLAALGDAIETPPEAQQGWVDQVLQAGTVATEAADRAEEAAVRQPYPNAETGTWWVWNAESGAYEDTGISYGTGDSGGGVTDHERLTGRDKADQHPMIAITGLEDALAGKQPTGTYLTEETDPTVPDWAKQPEKPSYTADEVGALSSETLPEAITTALAQAKESGEFDGAAGQDGAPGQDGITPTIGDNGNWYLGDTDTGKPSRGETGQAGADGRDGADGQPGADGKSAYQYAVEGGYTGTEAEFAAKLAEQMPDRLPNPNALTFTGAVTGRYDGSAPLEVEIPSGGGGLTVTNTATIGQIIKVSAVDENGQPTEWEAVDMASGGGSISLPLLYDLTTSEEVGWIDTGDNAFLAKSLLFVELISIATTTNQSDGSGSASMYPLKSGIVQAPWNNQVVAVKTAALMAKTYTKVFRAFCFRGDEGHWTSITSIRNTSNEASVTPGMVSARIDGVTDQPMRGLIIGNAAASSKNVLGVGSRLRVWGV